MTPECELSYGSQAVQTWWIGLSICAPYKFSSLEFQDFKKMYMKTLLIWVRVRNIKHAIIGRNERKIWLRLDKADRGNNTDDKCEDCDCNSDCNSVHFLSLQLELLTL